MVCKIHQYFVNPKRQCKTKIIKNSKKQANLPENTDFYTKITKSPIFFSILTGHTQGEAQIPVSS